MVQFDIEKVVNQMDQLIRYVKLSKNPLVNEAILCQGGSIERASGKSLELVHKGGAVMTLGDTLSAFP